MAEATALRRTGCDYDDSDLRVLRWTNCRLSSMRKPLLAADSAANFAAIAADFLSVLIPPL